MRRRKGERRRDELGWAKEKKGEACFGCDFSIYFFSLLWRKKEAVGVFSLRSLYSMVL